MDSEEMDDALLVRLANTLVADFDGACSWIAAALDDHDQLDQLLTSLSTLARDAHEWVPTETVDRIEAECLPQLVQLVLARRVWPQDTLARVHGFIDAVLDRTAHCLLQCDPCLLPSLVRIFDDHRPLYSSTSSTEPPESTDHHAFVSDPSSWFLTHVAYWGHLGGFTLFLRCLQARALSDDTESSIGFSVDAIQCVFRAIYAVKDHLSGRFLLRIAMPFVHSTQLYLETLATDELTSASRETLLEMVHILDLVVVNVVAQGAQQDHKDDDDDAAVPETNEDETDPTCSSTADIEQRALTVRLTLLLRLFTSSSLEKRIFGLTEILGILGTAEDTTTIDTLRTWLDECAFVRVLLGTTRHNELIKRATPLFQFIVTHCTDTCRNDALATVFTTYTAASSDSERTTLHRLLLEMMVFLDTPQLEWLLTQCSTHCDDPYTLGLLTALARQRRQGTTLVLRERVLMQLWFVLPTASRTIRDDVLDAMDELLRLDDDTLVDEFARLCLDNLERHEYEHDMSIVSISLRLVEKLGTIVHETTRPTQSSNERVPVGLLVAILRQLAAYKSSQDTVNHDVDHIPVVRESLLALRGAWLMGVLASPSTSLGTDQLGHVWQLCVEQARSSDEASLCFQWIEYCATTPLADGVMLLPLAHAEFLLGKFATLRDQQITPSALCSFHQLFRHVNHASGALIERREPDHTNDNDDTNATVHDVRVADASPLVGMTSLWSLALYAQDHTVAEEAITLLARCHLDFDSSTSISVVLQTKLAFIETCMTRLAREDEDERVVTRCMDSLRYFLDACESTTANTQHDHQHQRTLGLDHLEARLEQLPIVPSPMKDAMTESLPGPRRPSWTFRQHHALLDAIRDNDGDGEDDADHQRPASSWMGFATTHSLSLETTESSMLVRRRSLDTSDDDTTPIVWPTQRTKSPSVRTRPTLEREPEALALGPEAALVDVDVALAAPDTTSSSSSADDVTLAHVLAQRDSYYDALFTIVNDGNSGKTAAVSRRAWDLLCQLPTHHALLLGMIRLRPQDGADVDWSALWLDTTSVYRLQYALRIVHALLLEQDHDTTHNKDAARRQWRERFVRLGGVEQVYTCTRALLTPTDTSLPTEPLRCACLAGLLRVLTYFTRLASASSSHTLSASSSPFDTRLATSTLPRVFASGAVVSIEHALGLALDASRQDGPCIVASVELVAAMAILRPTRALAVLEDQQETTTTMWLERVVMGTTSEMDQSASMLGTLDALAEQLATHNRDDRAATTQLLDHFVRASVHLLVMRHNRMPLHAYDLAASLLKWMALVSDHTRDLIDWLTTVSVLDPLVHQLDAPWPSTTLPGLLRVLTALVAVSPSTIATAMLQVPPPPRPTSPSPDHQSSWILNVLIHRLFAVHEQGSSTTSTLDVATRQLAYTLVTSLCSSTSSLSATGSVLASLMSFHSVVERKLNAMGRPWQFTPRDQLQTPDTHFAGLVNPGCVCYMNSLIQQLFMMPAFRAGLLALDSDRPDESEAPWASEVTQLQALFVSLTATTLKAMDPTPFALSHADLDGNPTDLHMQMDADEFFCLLLDRIDTFLGANESNFLASCFGGVLVNQIETEHGDLSEREEPFFALSLDLAGQTLTDSLALYVQGETLEGENAYYCEQTRRKVTATKRVCIKTLPHTLVCHLKRFAFDFDTMEKLKRNEYLAFPDQLDLYPYTSEAIHGATPDKTALYDLVGVVVHSGTSDMGHYYSFIRDRTTTSDRHWLEFNDQTVRTLDPTTIADECFGGDEVVQKWDPVTRTVEPAVQTKKRSAYMLVYERRADGETTMERTSVSTTVRGQLDTVRRDNGVFQCVVDAFDSVHDVFVRDLLETCYTTHDGRDMETSAKVACEHVLGVAALRHVDKTNTEQEDADSGCVVQILQTLTEWVERTDQDDRVVRWCEWLLDRVVASPVRMETEADCDDASAIARRSWLFDTVYLGDDAPARVGATLALLRSCVQRLAAQDVPSVPLRAFLSDVVRLFYDREDVELLDPTTGSRFPLSQTAIVQGVTLLGAFLKDCCAMMDNENHDDNDEDRTTRSIQTLLLTEAHFVDRFLFTLQTDRPDTSTADAVGSSTNSSGPNPSITPLTSRIRSCTFTVERELLASLARVLPTDHSIVDGALLVQHTSLKNALVFAFDTALGPFLVHFVRHTRSRTLREQCLALLVAVLEDVKTTHVDALLAWLERLLDLDDDGSSDVVTHTHLLSPTTGILEAAAYYRDHRTLHEYAFLLVELATLQASKSRCVQRYFQSSGVREQVAWIPDWLVSYLDPMGGIRKLGRPRREAEEHEDEEEASLMTEVRRLFVRAECAFGYALFDHDELVERDEGDEQADEDGDDASSFLGVHSLGESDDDATSQEENQQDDDDEEETKMGLEATPEQDEATDKSDESSVTPAMVTLQFMTPAA